MADCPLPVNAPLTAC